MIDNISKTRFMLENHYTNPEVTDLELIHELILIGNNQFIESKDLAKYLDIKHEHVLKTVGLKIKGYPVDVDRGSRPIDATTALFVVCRVILDRME